MMRHSASRLNDIRPTAHRVGRRIGVGERLLDALIGITVLALIAVGIQWTWQYWGQNLDTISTTRRIERAQGWDGGAAGTAASDTRIAQPRYSEPPSEAAPAYAGVIGHMMIPRLGSDWDRIIQEGTGTDVLDNLGVGHYQQSVMPGSLGVTAYAGHRPPASLWLLDTVKPGDAVVIRTRDYWYVYRIQTTPRIVDSTDWSVLDPVEGQRTLVLTTCDPKWVGGDAANRLVATATFDYWARVADGTVRELTGPKTEAKGPQAVVSTVSSTVSTVTHDAPVTPFLAAVAFGAWLLLDAAFWLLDRRCALRRLSHEGWWSRWNPMVMLWRIQAGVLPIRIILYALMWLAAVCACWAWVCPWAAETIPWLATPHPTMG